jgi:hypothetical protein
MLQLRITAKFSNEDDGIHAHAFLAAFPQK